ncbi:toll-like receptor 5 [Gastrophryne carolinensis]
MDVDHPAGPKEDSSSAEDRRKKTGTESMSPTSTFLLLATICCDVLVSYSLGCSTFTTGSRSVLLCQAHGLLTVPPVPYDAEIALLNFNRISSVSRNSFPNLPRLQGLFLGGQENVSLYIGQGAFENLPNLISLDLGGNGNLGLHREAFKGLFKLQVLILDSNRLDKTVLESGLFGDLLSLRKLDLSYNKIHRLRPDPSFLRLSLLTTIVLKLNNITQLCGSDLENLKGRRLELLDLSSNPLQVSNASTCSSPFENIALDTLDISSMGWNEEKFGRFFKTISGTQIKHLKMRYSSVMGSGFAFNNLKNPDENTFAGLSSSNVYTLDMSHGYISELAPRVFSAFPKLLLLDLSSNKVNMISKGAFSGLKQLVSLNMSGNLIGDIKNSSFGSLWSSPLRALDLSSNNIGAIQFEAMNGLVSLETLSLRDNALNRIPHVQLPALTLVLLKQNRISDTYGLASFCPNCTFLDLSSNRLTDLRSLWDILQLRSLKTLLLSSNKLSSCSTISYRKPAVMSDLYYLDLSDNDLGLIWTSGQCTDIFSNLKSLEILNLAKNYIATIPKAVFQGLQSLQTLDLSRNNLRLIHDELFTGLKALKTLNIGSNNFLTLSSQSFKPLTSLQSIDLSQTKLVCNCGLTELWSWIKSTNVTVLITQNEQITCLMLSSSPVREISLEDYSNYC